jgi:hypothetical protein
MTLLFGVVKNWVFALLKSSLCQQALKSSLCQQALKPSLCQQALKPSLCQQALKPIAQAINKKMKLNK